MPRSPGRPAPPLNRRELIRFVRSADVGLLPHRASRLTTGTSPLKLFEYLAGGLPVAATDLDPIRAVGHRRVLLVPAGGDFAAAARAALDLGPAAEDERVQFIEDNSWRLRHDQLLDLAFA